MSRYRSLRAAVIFIGLMIPAQALALEFVTVGPRAMGMGGAGVAVTTDALATYWNPAGLAMTQTVDIRIQGSGQVIDRLGIADAVHDLENFDTTNFSQTNIDKARDIAARINRDGATVSINGSAGLYIKGHLGEHAFGLNVSDVATGGGFVPNSNPVRVVCDIGPSCVGATSVSLTGTMALRALEVRQVAFSYAYAFADKMFSIGVTGKFLQGAAYSGATTLTGGNDVSISDNFGKPTISTAFGIDVGAIYRPSSWLRIGAVAKDINQPTFNDVGGGELKLGPQVRGGVAVNPYSSLTLTADVDATANRTFVPGVKSQVLSVGAEQTILSEFLSFRVGAFKNMKDAGTPFTPTAGLGLRIFALRVDVGGGYDFREEGALVSGSVSLTF
ncbi:MAG: conjugal transfer protein TraF [Nitrospiraceae bacterium]|nr:conjugal transfer protein TraF [Nitrospiraceae bacterium]